MESRCTGKIFNVTITTGLVQLMARQTRSSSWRIWLNGISLVKIAFFIKFLQQIPQRFDIFVIVSDIRIVQINPITHLLGKVGPFFGIFHHLTTTSGIVFINRNLLADILFGDTQHFLHAQFNRQTVRIPTRLTANLETLHRLETAERIFYRSRHHMVNTWHSVS